ncbi:autophagy-related protein 16a [Hordeum vulgare]|nr:autophagy-related protein 16a [Hordeum vulgare]
MAGRQLQPGDAGGGRKALMLCVRGTARGVGVRVREAGKGGGRRPWLSPGSKAAWEAEMPLAVAKAGIFRSIRISLGPVGFRPSSSPSPTQAEADAGKAAIRRALRSLRRRHLVEEGAHRPAIEALNRPFAAHALEWKEKAEKNELELQQCYKAQSRLSEQLVSEINEAKTSKALLKEKEALITTLQSELGQTREENVQLKESLEEKTNALDLLIQEHQAAKAELERVLTKLKAVEHENTQLVERLMQAKMVEAEKLNEANAMYEEMVLKLKAAGLGAGGIQHNAQQEADGVIRRSEAGYVDIMETPIPSTCRVTIRAHDGGCGSIIFQNNTDKLISGGQDQTVKIWSAHTGALTSTLQGCLGTVNDLAVTNDNKFVIAACSSNKLFVWEINGGRPRHTLTGHTKNVCSVGASWAKSLVIASSSNDRTIKIWDLQTGFCKSTIMSASNPNTLAFIHGDSICSGHRDGSLKFHDIRSGKCFATVAGHADVSSVCVTRSKNHVLSSGRDGVHKLFDVRMPTEVVEICGTFRAPSNRLIGSWGRACISPDENCIAAGCSDGSVCIWSRSKNEGPTILEGHSLPVVTSAWSEFGPLATADKNHIHIWA